MDEGCGRWYSSHRNWTDHTYPDRQNWSFKCSMLWLSWKRFSELAPFTVFCHQISRQSVLKIPAIFFHRETVHVANILISICVITPRRTSIVPNYFFVTFKLIYSRCSVAMRKIQLSDLRPNRLNNILNVTPVASSLNSFSCPLNKYWLAAALNGPRFDILGDFRVTITLMPIFYMKLKLRNLTHWRKVHFRNLIIILSQQINLSIGKRHTINWMVASLYFHIEIINSSEKSRFGKSSNFDSPLTTTTTVYFAKAIKIARYFHYDFFLALRGGNWCHQ